MRVVTPEAASSEWLVTGKEAAELCGVSPVTIRTWVHRRGLRHRAILIGSTAHLYSADDVIACNERQTHGAGTRAEM